MRIAFSLDNTTARLKNPMERVVQL
jgi:hypothetical protein